MSTPPSPPPPPTRSGSPRSDEPAPGEAPFGIRPAARLEGLSPYQPGEPSEKITLALDANEGPPPPAAVRGALGELGSEAIRRYPKPRALEQAIADRWGIDPDRVVVTNGGDDAIDRVCRALLEPGREMLVHTPTFEMIERSARLSGGGVRAFEWLEGPFPQARAAELIGPATSLISLVSPNNPTGGVIEPDVIARVAQAGASVGAAVMVDLAYAEFADEDPTRRLLEIENAVIVRTFSKALGLAGLRVGYAIAPPPIARWLRTTGGPYPVASGSIACALAAIEGGHLPDPEHIARVRAERAALARVLSMLGARPLDSQGNFVGAWFDDAAGVRAQLARDGIGVRGFAQRSGLEGLVRITLPGDGSSFRLLLESLARAMRATPQAREAITQELESMTQPHQPDAGRDREENPSVQTGTGGRAATVRRTTNETDIELTVALDGSGQATVDSGLGFLDHMLGSLAKHSRMDLSLRCAGDTRVDDHHSVEDCALSLGSGIDRALGDRGGIARFGWAYAPLDEALARVVVDLSGRPHATVELGLARDSIGDVASENIEHFFCSLAISARCTIHAEVIRGRNDHHRAEAAFKALALALRQALKADGPASEVPSTKGVL